MSSVILKRIYNISIYVIGTCVLLAATFATLVRVLLPDVGMYRSEVEAWVSNYMELPVVIHSIKADCIMPRRHRFVLHGIKTVVCPQFTVSTLHEYDY